MSKVIPGCLAQNIPRNDHKGKELGSSPGGQGGTGNAPGKPRPVHFSRALTSLCFWEGGFGDSGPFLILPT